MQLPTLLVTLAGELILVPVTLLPIINPLSTASIFVSTVGNRRAMAKKLARQIAVKAKYALWVTDAERNAMRVVLDRCPAEPLPAG